MKTFLITFDFNLDMNILCLIGLHKWSEKKGFVKYGTNTSDYARYCLRCHKKQFWKGKREEEKEDEEIEV